MYRRKSSGCTSLTSEQPPRKISNADTAAMVDCMVRGDLFSEVANFSYIKRKLPRVFASIALYG